MNKKQYTFFRLILAMILAVIVSVSVSNGNYIVPIFAMAVAIIFILILRKKVVEVLADERDYQMGGRAARLTISIFAIFSFILSMIFYAMQKMQPEFATIGSTLAYSACAVMIIYSLVFTIINRNEKTNRNKIWFILLIIFVALIMAVISLRILSGEDSWMCENGEWVTHGHPETQKPNTPCER